MDMVIKYENISYFQPNMDPTVEKHWRQTIWQCRLL